MERRKQSKGSCAYCHLTMTNSGMGKHLQTCDQRRIVIEKASLKSKQPGTFYHLSVQDAYQGDFWLHLEMSGQAKLAELDNYLRAIWLECCGHMSEFLLGNRSGDEIAMNQSVDRIFAPGRELYHIYDFGTSSETKIKVISARAGQATTRHPIVLMARNDPPELRCCECEKPAQQVCLECLMENDDFATFCKKHAQQHEEEHEEGLVALVNSPRLGMCGYTGPADPPY